MPYIYLVMPFAELTFSLTFVKAVIVVVAGGGGELVGWVILY